MKAIAKLSANLKPIAGGSMPAGGWIQLPVGGWVFGSVGTTDITGFSHYYRADGVRVGLGALHKCSLTNLYPPTNEVEQELPPVDPLPDTDTFPSYLPIGAEWQMRFKLTADSEWTEYYTFKRME